MNCIVGINIDTFDGYTFFKPIGFDRFKKSYHNDKSDNFAFTYEKNGKEYKINGKHNPARIVTTLKINGNPIIDGNNFDSVTIEDVLKKIRISVEGN